MQKLLIPFCDELPSHCNYYFTGRCLRIGYNVKGVHMVRTSEYHKNYDVYRLLAFRMARAQTLGDMRDKVSSDLVPRLALWDVSKWIADHYTGDEYYQAITYNGYYIGFIRCLDYQKH